MWAEMNRNIKGKVWGDRKKLCVSARVNAGTGMKESYTTNKIFLRYKYQTAMEIRFLIMSTSRSHLMRMQWEISGCTTGNIRSIRFMNAQNMVCAYSGDS